MVGILLAIVAAASWGASAIFVRKGLLHLKTTTGTLISLAASLVVLLPVVVIFDRDEIGTLTKLPLIAFLWLFLSGFFNFGLGRLLNYNGVRLAGVTRASPIMSVAPLFSILLAVIFLGEEITPLLLLGAACIVAGSIVVVSGK